MLPAAPLPNWKVEVLAGAAYTSCLVVMDEIGRSTKLPVVKSNENAVVSSRLSRRETGKPRTGWPSISTVTVTLAIFAIAAPQAGYDFLPTLKPSELARPTAAPTAASPPHTAARAAAARMLTAGLKIAGIAVPAAPTAFLTPSVT